MIIVLVIVTNNKGGQGKTFIATLLAFSLMENSANKDKVVCCDRNLEQKNFALNLSKSDIPVNHDDPMVRSIGDPKLCIVDTSPNLIENMPLIRRADIVIVPLGEGLHALHGLKRIHTVRGKQDLKVIINEWQNTSLQRRIEKHLKQEGYNIVGHLPKYQRIMNNLDTHRSWKYGLTKQQKDIVTSVLVKAVR